MSSDRKPQPRPQSNDYFFSGERVRNRDDDLPIRDGNDQRFPQRGGEITYQQCGGGRRVIKKKIEGI